MKLITKIKRLSADYRKHEKEMAEIELKKMIEMFKTISVTQQGLIQMQLIAQQPKIKPENNVGIVPDIKTNAETVKPHPANDETLQKIKSDIENNNGRISIKIYPENKGAKH